ncbi:MAG: DUF433 domain-containing protein [Gammaproteobacteria bacterium]
MKADEVISRSPQVQGGTPVFRGTRVPVRTLIDYLESGDRLEDFLEEFPTVTREQAIQVMELASEAILKLGNEAAA